MQHIVLLLLIGLAVCPWLIVPDGPSRVHVESHLPVSAVNATAPMLLGPQADTCPCWVEYGFERVGTSEGPPWSEQGLRPRQAEGPFGTSRVGEARNPGPQRLVVSANVTSMFKSIDSVSGHER